ncbi:MAG: preprotein translocase subunit YajC [Rikenellaceae bacterium]
MNLSTIFIQDVPSGAQPDGGGMQFIIMMVLIFAVMYFFMIRPQQKRQKELVNFRKSLTKGDKIITAGGIYGTIKEIKELYVIVEVDSNVAIRIDKSMIMKDNTDLVQTK